ncbi:MAG: 30S ribosomal protein S3 [Planctomycetaceae bacterium]
MGQKTRPTGFRVGIVEDWRSRWYAPKKEYGPLLVEDKRIRDFISAEYKAAAISRVEIERTRDSVVCNIHSARPGILIGRKGQEIDRLKARLEDLTGRRMEVKIHEINNPFRVAVLVAQDISQQLQKRGSFRRAIKKTLEQVMEAGCYGVKAELSGRLGGAEMSRQEKAMKGSIPLSTLQRHIDYGFAEAKTAQGVIGIKVWIDLGNYADEETGDGANAKAGQAPKGPKRSHKR